MVGCQFGFKSGRGFCGCSSSADQAVSGTFFTDSSEKTLFHTVLGKLQSTMLDKTHQNVDWQDTDLSNLE
jgi:hypothetical protein